MTPAEVIELIESAGSGEDLFGTDGAIRYRSLARLVHPDACPGNARAARAFARLAEMWWQRETFVAAGDIANLFACGPDLVKVARDPADNDLMDREVRALRALRTSGEERFLPYVPELRQVQRRLDQDTGVVRHANLLRRLDGFRTLAEVHAAYPGGVDPRDVAWMWRRLLVALGFAHRTGIAHAAVLPEHVLIHPAEHGLVLVDWCYSLSNGPVPAIVASRRDWYPDEVLGKQPATPGTDIYLAASCMTYLLGGAAPRPMLNFARGCMLRNQDRRPADAWALLAEFDDLLDRLYGPRAFHPFTMPA